MSMPARGSIVAERQAPLRELYAERRQEAVTCKSARTTSSRVAPGDPFHGEVEVGTGYGTSLRFGLDRHIGGLDDAPNPGDLLCAALAAAGKGDGHREVGVAGTCAHRRERREPTGAAPGLSVRPRKRARQRVSPRIRHREGEDDG